MKTYNVVTFMIVPFRLTANFYPKIPKAKVWMSNGIFEGQNSDAFKEGLAFPYIYNIFKSACEDNDEFRLYTLSNTFSSSVIENKLFLHTDNALKIIPFKFTNAKNSFYSPKLLISTSSEVGKLVIPIQINPPTKQIEYFGIEIGYLHEFIRYMRATWLASIYGDSLNAPISLNDIINELMIDFEKGSYVRFNDKYALHYTCFIADTDVYSNELEKKLINITRCKEQIDAPIGDSVDVIQPLKQLYVASSPEGISIMAVGDINKIPYVRFFENELTEVFIWIYLLITLQRYSLIRMILELTELRDTIKPGMYMKTISRKTNVKIVCLYFISILVGPQNKIADKLRLLIKKFSMLRINTSYNVISEDSACDKFYQLCSESAGIFNLSKEIERKTEILNEYLSQQSESRKEMMDWQLSVLLAILTVTSASNDVLELIKKLELLSPPDKKYVIFGFLFIVVTMVYIFSIIIRTLRNKII